MKLTRKHAVIVGSPIVAGVALLGSATPAFADGPLESASVTQAYINNQNQTVTCTLTLSLISHYQNDTKRGLARWSITNSLGCRNASLYEQETWVTPHGGSGYAIESFSGGIPAQSEEVYSPINPTVARPDGHDAFFTEYVAVSFNNCMNNCSMSLSLTADGKP